MATVEVKVPDIGDFDEVAVIEVLVKVGDTVKAEQSLITVESDKASMEIPSSQAGVVKELKVEVGSKVKEGSVVLVLEGEGGAAAAPAAAAPRRRAGAAPAPRAGTRASGCRTGRGAAGPIDVKVPDIGDFKDVAVIEVLVKPGDTIKDEQSLITVESDKASMEIPSSAAGVLKELKVKVGDTVNIGDLIAVIEGAAAALRRRRAARRGTGAGRARHPHRPAPPRRAPAPAPTAALPAHDPTARPPASCRTRRLRCASSRATSACRWKKSRAAAPRAASRRKTSRTSPRP